MSSDRGGRKRKRKEFTKALRPGSYLIVTEGTETEVNYFKNIKKIIEKRYRSNVIVEKVEIDVSGHGRSTKVLVNEAIKIRSLKSSSEVWVVFDKDNNDDFDEAINLANKNNLNVAWSNACFELWLLLHFQNLESAISIDDYKTKLNNNFMKQKINNGKYDKNIINIFDITFSNIDIAIKRSEKLLQYHESNGIVSPTKMNPATTVQNLIKEFLPYLK